MLISTLELDTKLRAKAPGAYLFYGEEEYLKRHWLNMTRKSLVGDSDFAAFNHVIVNGGDLDAFEAELASLPMLDMLGTGHRLVELRDANFDKMSKAELERLCLALSDVGNTTALIYTLPSELSEGTKKKPSAPLAALMKVCSAVNFERQTPAKLISWLSRHFASNGCIAVNDTCRALIDYCTADMFILSNEVFKLCAYARSRGQERVDASTVYKVCSPKKDFGSFDLSNALLEGNIPAALHVVDHMIRQKTRPEEIMATIAKSYTELHLIKVLYESGMNKSDIAAALKMNEYALSLRLRAASRFTTKRLEKIISLCYDADNSIKSAPVNKYYIIEELILQTEG